jgi:hypothetical protein
MLSQLRAHHPHVEGKPMSAVRISSKHCRAICDEVGERLRRYLDDDTTAPPPRLLALLRALELAELEAPSIVPSLEDVIAPIASLS